MDNPSEPNDRECHSPLGLFEKFKMDVPPESVSFPDPDLQLSSVSESPSTLGTTDSLNTPSVNKVILNKPSIIERMRWMMNTASNVRNKFEKFKMDVPPESVSFPDPDLQLSSVSESPSTLGTTDSLNTPSVNKVILNKPSIIERMRWMMNTASNVRNRKEDESCVLLGSWNADSREVVILDELESPSDQTESGHPIIIQDGSDDDSTIICEEDGQLLQKKVKFMLDKTRSAGIPQVSGNPANPKGKPGKRKSKKKTCDGETVHNSLILTSTKSPRAIRDTTVQTLYDVLMKRVKETQDLDVTEGSLRKLARNVEEEIFNLYHNTGMRYKTKYRSLLFNLKDPKNKVFFQCVVLGEITPQCLVLMSPTEMANQELTDWRNQERQHTLEIIQRTEKELNKKQQMVKLTHKGLIEIDMSPDQMFTLEDLSDTPWYSKDIQNSDGEKIDTTAQHKTHLLDLNCLICMGKIKPSDMMDKSQWTKVKSPIKTAKENSPVEKLLCSETGEAVDSMEKDVLGAKGQNASSSHSAVWKGFIQMFSIKQFRVTAEQVSGYSVHLCQELPKVITSKGFICQESVWEYIDRIWPACTKDMCLLRFCPQTSSDAVFYSRLHSYISRKLRYVIINTNKVEAFIIPLPACQPIPSNLHPLGGPGLDDDHPHLLLALLLPNNPSWSSCPKKVSKIQIEDELEVPDDIFSSILEDVEKEEKQMTEQGLPPVGQECAGIGEVGMPELINILCLLSNNLQEIAVQNNNNLHILPLPNQPNPILPTAPVWPTYMAATSFQAPPPYGNNSAAFFDPSSMFGPF